MAKIGLPKGSGKRLKVREKSVKSQGILKWILSGNTGKVNIPSILQSQGGGGGVMAANNWCITFKQ